jgi:thioredoxin 1
MTDAPDTGVHNIKEWVPSLSPSPSPSTNNHRSVNVFKSLITADASAPAATTSDADPFAPTSSLIAIDFYATWCPPCKAIAPKYVELAGEYAGKARFYKVDVDEVPAAAQECGVSAMPTFMFFKGGEKVGTVVGANLKGIKDVVAGNV